MVLGNKCALAKYIYIYIVQFQSFFLTFNVGFNLSSMRRYSVKCLSLFTVSGICQIWVWNIWHITWGWLTDKYFRFWVNYSVKLRCLHSSGTFRNTSLSLTVSQCLQMSRWPPARSRKSISPLHSCMGSGLQNP